MDYTSVKIERNKHVGIIVLNRPEQFNTFNTSLAEELCKALLELEMDKNVRVAVIRGAGKAFCTGIDLAEFPGKTQQQYREWISLMERVVHVIAYMKKPVIASAHGYAVANGAGLIAACDLAIAAEGTKIGATAINVGLFCMGPAVPLSRSIGRKRCLELVMTGDMIDAREAERWGLINRVVPPEKLEEETMALANKLAEKSPLALQMGKEAFYGMSDMEYGKALAYSNEVFAALCMTEDAKEGVDAFLNKRKPQWKEE
ncbi:MAG: enoyl-CoA hydratase/isomerase family protein [Deltaproteobacteria bacterium]|nr:enoyl-CoA hydratase/isomerase family protein [Deltaproteobacteria bacterium]MBW2298845.1 enoyl-CoA hydratase/isomerase family protein [Deltaproteobacteria bacterium]RLB34468.1 MAG: enoyl-CoA hydratase/isomerase family protein [Deltaproteobacteria bacterium]